MLLREVRVSNLHLKTILLFLQLLIYCELGLAGMKKAEILEQLRGWYQSLPDQNMEAREKDLRSEFVQRLIFQTDSKYSDANAPDLKIFFKSVAWDLYLTDNMKENRSFTRYPKFLLQLHKALSEVIEPREPVVAFIRNFTEFTSVTLPKDLQLFAASRNYYDGKQMLEANPASNEEASEALEKKLNEWRFELPERLKMRVDFSQEFTPPQLSECCKTQESPDALALDQNQKL